MRWVKTKKLHWKKGKTLAALANRRQWLREFDPVETSDIEIMLEQGGFLITETSAAGNPEYIRTE